MTVDAPMKSVADPQVSVTPAERPAAPEHRSPYRLRRRAAIMFSGSAVCLVLAVIVGLSSHPRPVAKTALDEWAASRSASTLRQPDVAAHAAPAAAVDSLRPPQSAPSQDAPAVASPKPAPPAAAPPPAALAPAIPPATPSAAGTVVQIGAFPSRKDAEAALSKAVARVGVLANRPRNVESVAVKGSTLYRAQLTGFDTTAEAREACAAIRGAGGDCFVK